LKSIKGKISEGVFLLIALSALSALALITVFIFIEGVPIIAKVGVIDFVFGMRWAPSEGVFGIFPMIIGSVSVTLGAAILGVPIALCCAGYPVTGWHTFSGIRVLGINFYCACDKELPRGTGAKPAGWFHHSRHHDSADSNQYL
jgi:hypothetical protein